MILYVCIVRYEYVQLATVNTKKKINTTNPTKGEKVRAESVLINFNLQNMIFCQLETQFSKNLYGEIKK
jgi:hypothetical protein